LVLVELDGHMVVLQILQLVAIAYSTQSHLLVVAGETQIIERPRITDNLVDLAVVLDLL
jgi:hypothetical protein